MGWPKGKPRKPKEESVASTPVATERKGLPPGPRTAGPKREGGKTALMAENVNIANMQQAEPKEKTEKEKIEDRYMQEAYGDMQDADATETSEQEQSQEATEEVSSASEEEQPAEEQTEGAPSEAAEEQEPKTYTEAEHKAALDRMHDATTEAANYRKLMEEYSPYIDWSKMEKEKGVKPVSQETTGVQAEKPTQEEMISDWDSFLEKMTKYVASKQTPEIKRTVVQQNEAAEVVKEFNTEFKDLPGGPEMFQPVLGKLAEDAAKNDPSWANKSYKERYDIVVPKFREFVKNVKQPVQQQVTKKKIPLESPAASKERAAKEVEKPIDLDQDRRDYIKFRQQESRRLRGLTD